MQITSLSIWEVKPAVTGGMRGVRSVSAMLEVLFFPIRVT